MSRCVVGLTSMIVDTRHAKKKIHGCAALITWFELEFGWLVTFLHLQ